MDSPENDYFTTEIARHIWDSKYRYRDGDVVHDMTIVDSWWRIARALAAVEQKDQDVWAQRFFEILEGFRFIPGGRIQAGAGTAHRVTLFNCFVMGTIEDTMEGIFDAIKECALTLQQGGGVGYDFSTLRPRGVRAKSVGAIASGPVSFMRIWDSMCATLLSTGARRGAMMATLRCDHPDVVAFIDAKRDKRELRHFNVSVLVSDAFMKALSRGEDWPLVFPDADLEPQDRAGGARTLMRKWPGRSTPVPCRILGTIPARALWDKIMRATYEYAEPGVLFIDRINRYNNLYYREDIGATNPCGEIPLPPYGACNLGSVNLTRFVKDPFTPHARLSWESLGRVVKDAVRMLDNVIDLSRFPLAEQAAQALGSRRIGLGMTGLADVLIMMGRRYGSRESCAIAAEIMREICHSAYRASIELAREKGPFPFYDRDKYLRSAFISTLPEDIRTGIGDHGIRNSHLTAIAPTGTISLLANNVSSGLEPVFDWRYTRRVLELDGGYREYELSDYAYRLWRAGHPGDASLPEQFIDARGLSPVVHLDMQAAVQPYVDNAISKTVNIPEDYAYESFLHLYDYAYDKGLKGCTTFRPNPVTGAVLREAEGFGRAPHCCDLEREAD